MCIWLRKREKTSDELTGYWTKEDDGSGLLGIWGWGITFNTDGTGTLNDWHADKTQNSETPFVWIRESGDTIKIKYPDADRWDLVVYAIEEVTGAYGTRYYRLTGSEYSDFGVSESSEGFWVLPKPLFRQC